MTYLLTYLLIRENVQQLANVKMYGGPQIETNISEDDANTLQMFYFTCNHGLAAVY